MTFNRVRADVMAGVILVASAVCGQAATIFFSGDLRNNANVTDCGAGCTLGPSNTDPDYAQYAAAVYSFVVTTATPVEAITYSYGGGVSKTGTVVAAGGFEPYLSLFDASGDFLASTYLGTDCPAGAKSVGPNCDDVELDSSLSPGKYQIAISASENMSYAENLGSPYLLSDGFTGLGNLGDGEDLSYAFDVILPNQSTGAPEPSSWLLALTALPVPFVLRRRMVQKAN